MLSEIKKEKICIFFMLYFTFSSLVANLKVGQDKTTIIYFLIVLSIFIIKKSKIKKNAIIYYTILLICILSTMIIKQDFTGGYFILIMSITVALLISSLIERKKFLEGYVEIISYIAIFAIFIEVIDIIGIKFSGITTFTNTYGVNYQDYILGFRIEFEGYRRIIGIFGESGMFQIYLNIALIFQLFYLENKRKNIYIISIAIFMTFSIVGIINFIAIYMIFICEKIELKKIINLILLIGIICILIFTIKEFKELFIEALEKLFLKQSSYEYRWDSIVNNIKYSYDNNFIGQGITNSFAEVFETYSKLLQNHNTSTTTAMLMSLGPIFTVINIIMIFKTFFYKKRKIICIFLSLVVLFSINTQLLLYDQMFYIICFSCFMREGNEKNENLMDKPNNN